MSELYKKVAEVEITLKLPIYEYPSPGGESPPVYDFDDSMDLFETLDEAIFVLVGSYEGLTHYDVEVL